MTRGDQLKAAQWLRDQAKKHTDQASLGLQKGIRLQFVLDDIGLAQSLATAANHMQACADSGEF